MSTSNLTYKATHRYSFGATDPYAFLGVEKIPALSIEDVGELQLWLLSWGYYAVPLRSGELLAMCAPGDSDIKLAILIGEYPKGTVCVQSVGEKLVHGWQRYKTGEHVDPTKL